MSASFTLSLVNPNASGTLKNVAYTDLDSGNNLNLIIGNNFGKDMTIGGTSTGKYLVLQISDNIIDKSGAAQLTVDAPWKIDSITAPSTSGGHFIINLLPPSGGVTIPYKDAITINLQKFLPSAKGKGQVLGNYEFESSGDKMDVSATLIVMSQDKPCRSKLIGDDGALRFTFSVNGNGESEPVVVCSAPVSQKNVVENKLQMVLTFQELTRITQASGPYLVDEWNPEQPPEFQFFFPYFNLTDKSPATIDLTDSFKQDDPSYNTWTSAWNIKESLDEKNPDILKNEFWEISVDPKPSTPAWSVKPTPENKHLFTTAGSDPNGPGPLLNLYWSHIISSLPVDQNNPQTLLYLLWIHFPGFNDGFQIFPLNKAYAKPSISSFEGGVARDASGAWLEFTWEATNANYCTLSADHTHTHFLTFYSKEAPCKLPISVEYPALSSYTLTAMGNDGESIATQHIDAKWQLNNNLSVKNPPGMFPKYTADGKKLVLLDIGSTKKCYFYDASTLKPLPIGPLSVEAINYSLTPDSETVIFLLVDGTVQGNDLRTLKTTPGSGAKVVGGMPAISCVALSPDGSKFIMGFGKIGTGAKQGENLGNNQLTILETTGFKAIKGSPFSLPEMPMSIVMGPQSGNLYVGLEDKVVALKAADCTVLASSTITMFLPGLMAITSDESVLYVLSIVNQTQKTFILTAFDPKNMSAIKQVELDYGFLLFSEMFVDTPIAKMQLSLDDKVLFITGYTLDSQIQNMNDKNALLTGVFVALDAKTLQNCSWSPLDIGTLLVIDLAISPDGSRLIAIGGPNDPNQGSANIMVFEPIFY